MLASEAKGLTAAATAPDGAKVKIVLDLWYKGIREAAKRGLSRVRQSELDRFQRAFIPDAARQAAREQLVKDGFTVKDVAGGRNETNVEVSW